MLGQGENGFSQLLDDDASTLDWYWFDDHSAYLDSVDAS